MAGNARDLAPFNKAVDSKLRGCDFVGLRVHDVVVVGHVKERAPLIRSKTGKPDSRKAAPFDPTVCADRQGLGQVGQP